MTETSRQSAPDPRFAFVNPTTPSIASLIEAVQADDSLTTTRKRDISSSIRLIARLIRQITHLPPERVPADVTHLRSILKRAHHEQAGVSKKRLQNAMSDLKHALKLAGCICEDAAVSLDDHWRTINDAIANDRLRWGLSRLFRFCSAVGLTVEQVDDTTIEQFRGAMEIESLLKDPDEVVRNSIHLWNQACKSVPGWRGRALTKITKRDTYTIPLDRFPRTFRDDVERFVERVSGRDLLAENAPIRPFSPVTVRHRFFEIRTVASAAVLSGKPIDEITDLAALLRPEPLRAALRYLIEHRHQGKTTARLHRLSQTMLSIARHQCRLPADEIEQIKTFCARLKPDEFGMTEKNRTRLRQFDDPRSVALLLDVPTRLLAEARRSSHDRKAAVLVQMALAIEILLMCPIRLRNLATLRLDRHLCRQRSRQYGVVHLVLEPEEVKNHVDMEFELQPDTVRLLDLYLNAHHGLLAAKGSPWLFPSRDGTGHKQPTFLSRQIGKHIERITGLQVNTHLFRHISAKLYLDAHPGSYELVRRVLGHRSIETTTRAYTGMESRAALRRFDETILDLRKRSATALPRKRANRRKRA